MFWKAYNSNGEMMAFATTVDYREQDEDCKILLDVHCGYGPLEGMFLCRTGSASFAASKIDPLRVTETFKHWQFGEVRVSKINRKTVKLEKLTDGELVTVRV